MKSIARLHSDGKRERERDIWVALKARQAFKL